MNIQWWQGTGQGYFLVWSTAVACIYMYVYTHVLYFLLRARTFASMYTIAIAAKNSLKLSWWGSHHCLSSRPAGRHGSWAPYRRSNINMGLSGMDKSLLPSVCFPFCLLLAKGITAHASTCEHWDPMCSLFDLMCSTLASKRWDVFG